LLEGGLRGGVADVDYTTNQFDNSVELGGVGWWVDAELGWRHGNWTFGGFFSFMSHTDTGTGPSICGYYPSWHLRLHVYELGARATWHRKALSVGAGLMPFVLGRPYGQEIVRNYYDPSGGGEVDTAQGWDFLPAAELHAGYDLFTINHRLTLQLFALVEVGLAVSSAPGLELTLPAPGLQMINARIGVGVTF
jgi:hypothetical protein